MQKKLLKVHTDSADVVNERLRLLRAALQDDNYTIRLWNAEAKLEELGYVRGRDGRWRKKVTVAELKELYGEFRV